MKKFLPLILILLFVLLPTYAGWTMSVYLLSGGNPTDDAQIQYILTIRGYDVTIGVELYLFDGTQANLPAFDAVVISNSWNWSQSSMPDTGQNAIIDYVSNGGGLVTGEWLLWNIYIGGRHTGLAQIMPATVTGYNYTSETTFYQVTSNPILNKGLPTSFSFAKQDIHGTESFLVEKTGATVYYDSSGTGYRGIVGWKYGSGRVINFSTLHTTTELSNPNYAQLLGNAVDFVTGFGSINGIVTDIAENPLRALVIAINADTKEKYIAISDPDSGGYYEILNLPPGTYWMLCIKKGYKTGIQKIEVLAGEVTECSFVLRPKLE